MTARLQEAGGGEIHEVQLPNASFNFEKVTGKKNMCIVVCGIS